jgi:hypothetical protein
VNIRCVLNYNQACLAHPKTELSNPPGAIFQQSHLEVRICPCSRHDSCTESSRALAINVFHGLADGVRRQYSALYQKITHGFDHGFVVLARVTARVFRLAEFIMQMRMGCVSFI